MQRLVPLAEVFHVLEALSFRMSNSQRDQAGARKRRQLHLGTEMKPERLAKRYEYSNLRGLRYE
jgi:hypothetical protein